MNIHEGKHTYTTGAQVGLKLLKKKVWGEKLILSVFTRW